MQLDRHILCAALERDKNVSAHRPISFRRVTPAAKNPEDKPIPEAEFRRDGWQEEVQNHFKLLCMQETHLNNPIRRLLLLKDAIRNVYDLHRGDFKAPDKDCPPDDKLGFTMACLRAIGRGQWIQAHLLQTPTLNTRPSHRKDITQAIKPNLSPQSEVLTIMCGDFNFVEHEMDRWNLEGACWSGLKDSGEADFFFMN